MIHTEDSRIKKFAEDLDAALSLLGKWRRLRTQLRGKKVTELFDAMYDLLIQSMRREKAWRNAYRTHTAMDNAQRHEALEDYMRLQEEQKKTLESYTRLERELVDADERYGVLKLRLKKAALHLIDSPPIAMPIWSWLFPWRVLLAMRKHNIAMLDILAPNIKPQDLTCSCHKDEDTGACKGPCSEIDEEGTWVITESKDPQCDSCYYAWCNFRNPRDSNWCAMYQRRKDNCQLHHPA